MAIRICCVHCDAPTIEADSPPAGWQDVVPLHEPADMDRTLVASGQPATGASHIGCCPACVEKRKPKYDVKPIASHVLFD